MVSLLIFNIYIFIIMDVHLSKTDVKVYFNFFYCETKFLIKKIIFVIKNDTV
jgi:hypothetical protein